MGSFNIRMLRLAVWSVFLLLAVEYRYTASSSDNQTYLPTRPTNEGAIKTTVATIHPTYSTSVSPSGHITVLPAKPQGPQITTNSNKTLFSSKDILTLSPPTAPAVDPHKGASSTNGTRTTPAPGEHSNTGASSTNGTRPTITPAVRPNTGSSSTNDSITTITPPTTLGEHSTNGTRTTIPPGEHSTPPASSTNGGTTIPPGEHSTPPASSTHGRTTIPPGGHSTPPASSTNGTKRNATWSIVPTLPTNSSPIPGGNATVTSTESSVPVTKQPCPTPSSTNGTRVSECGGSRSGVVSQCLVAIGLLASLLTVFVVSTVVLCAKLSSRRYSFDGQRGTEMVCLSTMMTGHNGTGIRPANLDGHRTLLTRPDDSDEDSGDNLTLNSFLPEGDRMV